MRGSWRPNRTATYWPLLLWPSALCLSRSPGLLNRKPRGPALCWMMAFSTASCLQLIWSPTQSGSPKAPSAGWWLSLPHLVTNGSPNSLGVLRAPSAGWWLSLPHLVSDFSDLQLTDFLSSPSYIIVQSSTQSPTQSLEWHVWSSSRGNNCHAVYRSPSSGASVYECTMGFLPCPIFSAKPANAISV